MTATLKENTTNDIMLKTRVEGFNDDMYKNDLTTELDKYLLDAFKKNYLIGTYLYGEPKERKLAIRYPGATRGGILFDYNNIITKIIIDDNWSCYDCNSEMHAVLEKYVGAKLIFPESE